MIKYLIVMIMLTTSIPPQTIFEFDKQADIQGWRIVDDVVMGGRSAGTFGINKAGHGVFSGRVSLENNGGFSSVRYRPDAISVKGFTKITLHVKGDGKKYQFRVKPNANAYYSYINTFVTSGEWEEIEIPLHTLYPSFRGMRLNRPNFSGDQIGEIAFLIGNKKAESFELLIDRIVLE